MLCWVIMIFLVPLYEAPRLDRLDLEETADVCPHTCTNQNRLKCIRSREHPGSTVRVRDARCELCEANVELFEEG